MRNFFNILISHLYCVNVYFLLLVDIYTQFLFYCMVTCNGSRDILTVFILPRTL